MMSCDPDSFSPSSSQGPAATERRAFGVWTAVNRAANPQAGPIGETSAAGPSCAPADLLASVAKIVTARALILGFTVSEQGTPRAEDDGEVCRCFDPLSGAGQRKPRHRRHVRD